MNPNFHNCLFQFYAPGLALELDNTAKLLNWKDVEWQISEKLFFVLNVRISVGLDLYEKDQFSFKLPVGEFD